MSDEVLYLVLCHSGGGAVSSETQSTSLPVTSSVLLASVSV